ncbi:MAG: tetratricopeptide repeat protein [Elusimicrobia bacterium]|nr:tetratricopeptide repeat protein [Elusimicrobiota bacterium]
MKASRQKAQPAEASPSFPPWLPPALTAFVVLLCFAPALKAGFVAWDDGKNFLENAAYRGLGWAQLRWMFTTFHLGHYQPLSWVTLGADYLLWGMNASGYHATNILLHAANAVAFYFLSLRLLRLGDGRRGAAELRAGAAFAALLFGVHPLRVESVAWVTERRDVLSGLFFLLTLHGYLKANDPGRAAGARARWFLASLTCYALSLLSKAAGVTLPLLLLLLDMFPLRRLDGSPLQWLRPEKRGILIEKIPFFLMAAVAGSLAAAAQHQTGAMDSLAQYGVVPRAIQAAWGLCFYLYKTLLPLHLNPLYRFPAHPEAFTWKAAASAGAVAALSGAAFAVRRKWPAVPAAWLFYVLVLLPVLGIAQSGPQYTADRYSYLSCLSWALLAGGLLARGLETASPPLKKSLLAAALFCIAALSGLSWRQTGVWLDSDRLWSRVLALDPDGKLAHYSYGTYLQKQGRLEEAVRELNEVLRIDPNHAQALNSLSVAFGDKGRFDEAVAYMRKALLEKPDDAKFHHNLASLFHRMGRFQEAVEEYGTAVRLSPDLAESHNNMAVVLEAQGRFDEAIGHFFLAIRANPGYSAAIFNLGNLLYKRGRLPDAIAQYERLAQIAPDFPQGHANLGIALANAGRLDEALAETEKAVRLDPNLVEAQANLGAALFQRGRFIEAAEHFRKVVELRPGSGPACNNLGAALLRAGKTAEAAETFRCALRATPPVPEARANLDRALDLLKKSR